MKVSMKFRVEMQLAEAFGPDNRWYCSQFHGRPIDDQNLLLIYFIHHGGAEDFDRRFAAAMGDENRWFCSEFYGREIQDAEVLWGYYTEHAASRISAELCVNC